MRIAAMMTLPALALLLLAAHFFRAGLLPLVALCLGTVEWLRTAWLIAAFT